MLGDRYINIYNDLDINVIKEGVKYLSDKYNVMIKLYYVLGNTNVYYKRFNDDDYINIFINNSLVNNCVINPIIQIEEYLLLKL